MAKQKGPHHCEKCDRVGIAPGETLCKYHLIERDNGPEAAEK